MAPTRSESAREVGVPEPTLRLWEQESLLPIFGTVAVDRYEARARMIAAARASGLSMQLIKGEFRLPASVQQEGWMGTERTFVDFFPGPTGSVVGLIAIAEGPNQAAIEQRLAAAGFGFVGVEQRERIAEGERPRVLEAVRTLLDAPKRIEDPVALAAERRYVQNQRLLREGNRRVVEEPDSPATSARGAQEELATVVDKLRRDSLALEGKVLPQHEAVMQAYKQVPGLWERNQAERHEQARVAHEAERARAHAENTAAAIAKSEELKSAAERIGAEQERAAQKARDEHAVNLAHPNVSTPYGRGY